MAILKDNPEPVIQNEIHGLRVLKRKKDDLFSIYFIFKINSYVSFKVSKINFYVC
jgi:hypothetical protein